MARVTKSARSVFVLFSLCGSCGRLAKQGAHCASELGSNSSFQTLPSRYLLGIHHALKHSKVVEETEVAP